MRRKTAIAFGSFDILHPGHIHYLRSASRYGDLTVVVARDRSVEKLKGKAPLMGERARLEIVGALGFVHRAVLGGRIKRWNDTYMILLKFRPDFIVFGYDQKVDMDYLHGFLKEHGLRSRIVRVGAYKSHRFKSSKIKEAASRIIR